MPWYYAVAERDHEIQNPTSAEKIALLGRYLRLDSSSRVLDLACGKGGPAVLLASTFGCTVLGIERAPEFVEAARERVAAAGVGHLVEIAEADAHAFPLDPAAWDAALCLGATFVWDDLPGTLAALAPTVRAGGTSSSASRTGASGRSRAASTTRASWRCARPSAGSSRRAVAPGPDRGKRRRLGPLRVAALAGDRGMARGESP
jgi:Predicted O-methyltransferase